MQSIQHVLEVLHSPQCLIHSVEVRDIVAKILIAWGIYWIQQDGADTKTGEIAHFGSDAWKEMIQMGVTELLLDTKYS